MHPYVVQYSGLETLGVIENSATFFLACIIGSLAPDIDSQTSKIGRSLKPLSKIVTSLFGHRRFAHSILFLGILELILIICGFNYVFKIGFMLGFMSHQFLDMLTISGVGLLYPLYTKKFRIMELRTGKKGETVVLILMKLSIVIILFLRHLFFFSE